MNYWDPYMNHDVSYDGNYDVDDEFTNEFDDEFDDELIRNENQPPAVPAAPPTMPAAHTYPVLPSYGCPPTPMWHGTMPWATSEMTPMTYMDSPYMGTSMDGTPVSMGGTMAPMMGAPMPGSMPFSYGPVHYGMSPYTYGYSTSPGYYPYW